jgi:predicted DNA-binding transcriptional regulator AlpA
MDAFKPFHLSAVIASICQEAENSRRLEMAPTEDSFIKRTIRRHQLREIVPLADSTIYEMEQRGEFPRRFALSPRCVVWDLAESPRRQKVRPRLYDGPIENSDPFRNQS